jgi:putative hydrolase of the HAD superfamily
MTDDIKAVWSDFGGVLTPPLNHTMSIFCHEVGVPVESFLTAMRTVGDCFGTDPMAPLDTPLVSEEEWARQMEAVLRTDHLATVDLSDFGTKWFTDRETNEHWLEYLRWLRAGGMFVGMLSNMVPSWDRHWREMVSPESFDDLVMSFQVGCRKPEREIFDLAAAKAGARPAQCVLVDDIEANCAGAREAGWQAVHFTDTTRAIAGLELLMLDGAPERQVRT